jgi:hypothetical protein
MSYVILSSPCFWAGEGSLQFFFSSAGGDELLRCFAEFTLDRPWACGPPKEMKIAGVVTPA